MDILHRRPLFLCCAVFMLSSVVGLLLGLAGKLILGGLTLFGAVLYACLRPIKQRDTYRAVTAVAAGILAVLALLQSHMTFRSGTRAELQCLEQTTVQVQATVTDCRGSGGNMTAYALSLKAVNDRPVDGSALLTCYYVSDLRPGNEITLTATLLPLSEAAGDGYDATALMGDGYVIGLLSEDETAVTVTRESSPNLLVRAGNLRRALSARLNLLTGDGSHGLPSALLLGDKTALSDCVRRDFARAGVSHLLAISGLHVTLLFGLLGLFLRLARIPKRVRTVILSMAALGYLILLGFPPSATRAVIMLSVTYLSYMISERADPLTSLGLAGCLIIAVTPYAVVDAGFWMSFLATLGLITLMPLIQAWLDRPAHREAPLLWQLLRKDLVKPLAAVAVGLTAMSFTLSIVAAVIGEMGVLSPVSTILLTPLCAAVLVLSLLCLPLAGTSLGVFFGGLTEIICTFMTDLTAWMAKPAWVVVSLRHPAVVPIAAVMTIATLTLLVIRLPKRRRFLVIVPILAGWMAVGGVLTVHQYCTRDCVEVTYLQPSAASDALVLVSGRRGFVCDLTNGSLSSMTAAAREAKRQGGTELAVYMLTHYHTSTAGALSTLLDRETVRTLWLPRPADENDYYLLLSCLEKAELADVPTYLYDPGEALQVFGEGTLMLETTYISRSVQPVLLISLDVSASETGEDRLVYCGSAVFESILAARAAELAAEADTVIFGSHGPLFKMSYGDELDFTNAREVILSAYHVPEWFDPAKLPDRVPLWVGQKRLILRKG